MTITWTQIAGALFIALFASDPVLLLSVGLDSAERFSRSTRRLPAVAVYIFSSAFAAVLISFLILNVAAPKFGITSSTLFDGVTVLISALVSAFAVDICMGRFFPKLKKMLAFGKSNDAVTTGYNSAVVGIALLCRSNSTELDKSIIYCLIFSASVVIVYALIAVLREDLKEHMIPNAFRGAPILILLLGLAAIVAQGYAGVVI